MFTRCRFSQERLQVRGQLHNVIRRPGPKHEAVPGVLETWLEVWVFQPQQDLVNVEPVKLRSQELVALLRISCRPVRCIQRLKFGLYKIRLD